MARRLRPSSDLCRGPARASIPAQGQDPAGPPRRLRRPVCPDNGQRGGQHGRPARPGGPAGAAEAAAQGVHGTGHRGAGVQHH